MKQINTYQTTTQLKQPLFIEIVLNKGFQPSYRFNPKIDNTIIKSYGFLFENTKERHIFKDSDLNLHSGFNDDALRWAYLFESKIREAILSEMQVKDIFTTQLNTLELFQIDSEYMEFTDWLLFDNEAIIYLKKVMAEYEFNTIQEALEMAQIQQKKVLWAKLSPLFYDYYTQVLTEIK